MRNSRLNKLVSNRIMRWSVFLHFITSCIIFTVADLHANESTVWNVLKSNDHFAMMRHSKAPGTGDPADFELGKCSTQRNLSSDGQIQAISVGEEFRANGIDAVRVFSSQWCRSLETAELLALGPVQELPALNSFFQKYDRQIIQTQMLNDWLLEQDLSDVLLLVTHQVNITALTGIYPGSGEVIIVQRSESGEFIPVDRFRID